MLFWLLGMVSGILGLFFGGLLELGLDRLRFVDHPSVLVAGVVLNQFRFREVVLGFLVLWFVLGMVLGKVLIFWWGLVMIMFLGFVVIWRWSNKVDYGFLVDVLLLL